MIVEIVLFAMLSLALYAAGWLRAAITAATEGN